MGGYLKNWQGRLGETAIFCFYDKRAKLKQLINKNIRKN